MTSISQEKNAQTKEKEEVKKTLKRFHRSIDQMLEGNPEPLFEVWAHREDAVNMGPFDQLIKGWKDIRQEINRQSQLNLASGQSFERTEPELIIGSDLAASYGYLKGKVKDQQGQLHTFKLRESIVLCKEKGKWKITGLHVDRLPFEA